MFEKIILRRSDGGAALTAGDLAEAMLFYQSVHIVLDHPTVHGLIDQIGMPRLLDLLSRPNVSAVYCEEMLGTHTDVIGGRERHHFVAFKLSGNQETGPLKGRKKRFQFILERKGYDKRTARKLADRFRDKVPSRDLTSGYYTPGGIVKAAAEDLLDAKFIEEAMRRVLDRTIGAQAIQSPVNFEIVPTPPYFHINTNIDFVQINARRATLDSGLGKFTPAHLIGEVLSARADTALASHYGGDFYTSALTSEVIRLRHAELLKRVGISQDELREFTDIVVEGSPAIREVINSGERSFDDFLALLEKSQRFREWIQSVNPDAKLVNEYFKEVTSEGWIAKLPGKTLRYLLTTALSIFQPLAGAALSATDSLLVEKMLRGWRPSHFIDRRLQPFLRSDDESN